MTPPRFGKIRWMLSVWFPFVLSLPSLGKLKSFLFGIRGGGCRFSKGVIGKLGRKNFQIEIEPLHDKIE